MKKFTLIPAALFAFLILNVGLTSCSKKYGCDNLVTTELKTRYVNTTCLGSPMSTDSNICNVLPNNGQ